MNQAKKDRIDARNEALAAAYYTGIYLGSDFPQAHRRIHATPKPRSRQVIEKERQEVRAITRPIDRIMCRINRRRRERTGTL